MHVHRHSERFALWLQKAHAQWENYAHAQLKNVRMRSSKIRHYADGEFGQIWWGAGRWRTFFLPKQGRSLKACGGVKERFCGKADLLTLVARLENCG